MASLYAQLERLQKALLKHKQENPVYSHRSKYAVGALTLDSNGSIISIAFNSYCKTHPYMKELASKTSKKESCYLHAEVAAIIKAKGKAKTLLVTRLTAKNTVALARPCPICEIALREAEIENVYYTNNDKELILFNWDRLEERAV